MSKTEGTLIAVNDSAQEIRRKVLAVDDSMTKKIFELCTEKEQTWIDEHTAKDPREFKEELAVELIRMYHGAQAVSEAMTATVIAATGPLDQVLKESGIVSSVGEAKRLVDQGGVQVNGVRAERWDMHIGSGDTLKVGKGKQYRVS